MSVSKELKILYQTYWNSIGWKDGSISPEDFLQAKNAGYMFDYPKAISHKETLESLHNVLEKITPKDIADAFLYSLSSRELEYRSALGSYWYAVAIPLHDETHKKSCDICGWSKWAEIPNQYEENHGINVYNFERYKFGGVRHCDLDYALFDLTQFLLLPKVSPSKEDKNLLKNILDCIDGLDKKNKAGKYRDYISKQKIIKSNKEEIAKLLDVFGICGILSTKDNPCYTDEFTVCNERNPIEHTNDFEYPVNRWHASDGVNEERFKAVFGTPI